MEMVQPILIGTKGGNPVLCSIYVLSLLARSLQTGFVPKSRNLSVLKDDSGSPKGTLIKGAIPREIAERWPMVSKLATIIV